MIIDERNDRRQRVIDAARAMMTAARTAPKARGLDTIEIATVTDTDIVRLSETMLELHNETGRPVYKRDSENIRQADAIVLIGIRSQVMGLNCGHCGYPTCGDKPGQAPCAMNCCDVGIALGSAVATAADLRVDTRIMFSAGMAAERLHLLGEATQIYAIAVSCSSKNPFFDRK